MKKIIIIGGPTASGKTELAIKAAKEFNGELINADSRQIYRYLDVGTNKGNIKELKDSMIQGLTEINQKASFLDNGGIRERSAQSAQHIAYSLENIPIHLISFLNPDERFSVYDYKILAEEKINEIIAKGKLPIIVGGTGLYIDALIKNYELGIMNDEYDLEARKQLEQLTVTELQQKLMAYGLEPMAALNESDRQNPRRLIRLIEKLENSKTPNLNTKKPHNVYLIEHKQYITQYDPLFLYPQYNWEALKLRIEHRVEEMFDNKTQDAKRKTQNFKEGKSNIISETQKVLALGFPKTSVALQGIGYRQVLDYLDGKISLNDCITLVKIAHKQYARRQRTWFEGKARGYDLNIIAKYDSSIINKFLISS